MDSKVMMTLAQVNDQISKNLMNRNLRNSATREIVRLEGRYNLDNLPTIEVGGLHPVSIHKQIDLKKYKEALANLKDGETFTIGREGYNDIKLDELPDFSRVHCYVAREDGEFVIVDCSLFGTKVVE